MRSLIYIIIPDILFIRLYEFIEKETRNHKSTCFCSNCKMFHEMSSVAEIRYDHDDKTYTRMIPK